MRRWTERAGGGAGRRGGVGGQEGGAEGGAGATGRGGAAGRALCGSLSARDAPPAPSPLGRDEVYEPRGARRGAALAWCNRPWGLQVTTSMSYWLRNIPTEVGEPTASTGGQRGDEQSSQSTAKAGSAAPRRSIAAIRSSYIISSGHFLVATLVAALATSGRRRGHAHGTVRPASPVQRPGRRNAAETRVGQVHRRELYHRSRG